MYPEILRIGSFSISSYGLMMALAFLASGSILYRELGSRGLDSQLAFDIVWRGALGGIVGAKVYYAVLYWDLSALWSRGGLVWYGGLLGGAALVTWFVVRGKLPRLRVLDAIALALPVGYAGGRLGCFLVGDDYGAPTDSWAGIPFPHGMPPSTVANLRHHFGVSLPADLLPDQVLAVHPTQLYEIAGSLAVFALLRRLRRTDPPPGTVLALALVLMAIERFLVELVRVKDDRFFGPLTLAQVISVVVIAGGLAAAARLRRAT